MAYRVDISKRALAEVDRELTWMRERSDLMADKWYGELLAALGSLEEMPNRCSIAVETHAFLIEIRQLLFGEGMLQHRIIFGASVDELSGEDVVPIYRVRGSSQRNLSGFEILGEYDDDE